MLSTLISIIDNKSKKKLSELINTIDLRLNKKNSLSASFAFLSYHKIIKKSTINTLLPLTKHKNNKIT